MDYISLCRCLPQNKIWQNFKKRCLEQCIQYMKAKYNSVLPIQSHRKVVLQLLGRFPPSLQGRGTGEERSVYVGLQLASGGVGGPVQPSVLPELLNVCRWVSKASPGIQSA